MKISVAAVEALKKKKDRMKPSLWPIITKIGGKTSFGSELFGFEKFSFPLTRLMHCYVESGRSRPLIARLYGYL
jgi:hypothetical protein